MINISETLQNIWKNKKFFKLIKFLIFWNKIECIANKSLKHKLKIK